MKESQEMSKKEKSIFRNVDERQIAAYYGFDLVEIRGKKK